MKATHYLAMVSILAGMTVQVHAQGIVIQESPESVELPAVSEPPRATRPGAQQQPTTYVEASPLTESNADRIRKARQEAELRTEQKIVEKLESSRLEDEKRRADALFGDRLNTLNSNEPQPQAQPIVPVAQPAPEVVVIPEPDTKKDDNDELKDELVNAVRAEVSSLKEEEAVEPEKYFMSGYIGGAEYPDAVNITASSSLGFGIGVNIPEDQITIEGTFGYSTYYIDQISYFNEMKQYNFDFAVKFNVLPGRVKPFIGGVAGYVYRKYTNFNSNGYYYGSSYRRSGYRPYGNYNDSSNSRTDSFDVGVTTGVDVEVTKNLTVGAGFKYMTNLTHQMDRDFYLSTFYSGFTPVEQVDYYVYSLNLKGSF
ncbi:MAG: outer membrane beta-barrel protein [Bdellovibrionales bacterium]|nr:outer membrane beta-barrel protein [Bdellovibrionales bacterium]